MPKYFVEDDGAGGKRLRRDDGDGNPNNDVFVLPNGDVVAAAAPLEHTRLDCFASGNGNTTDGTFSTASGQDEASTYFTIEPSTFVANPLVEVNNWGEPRFIKAGLYSLVVSVNLNAFNIETGHFSVPGMMLDMRGADNIWRSYDFAPASKGPGSTGAWCSIQRTFVGRLAVGAEPYLHITTRGIAAPTAKGFATWWITRLSE